MISIINILLIAPPFIIHTFGVPGTPVVDEDVHDIHSLLKRERVPPPVPEKKEWRPPLGS
jgi:hypothetical protein